MSPNGWNINGDEWLTHKCTCRKLSIRPALTFMARTQTDDADPERPTWRARNCFRGRTPQLGAERARISSCLPLLSLSLAAVWITKPHTRERRDQTRDRSPGYTRPPRAKATTHKVVSCARPRSRSRLNRRPTSARPSLSSAVSEDSPVRANYSPRRRGVSRLVQGVGLASADILQRGQRPSLLLGARRGRGATRSRTSRGRTRVRATRPREGRA